MPMPPASVVFLGTSAFAVPSLRALAADKRFRIDLVITQPDRPVGRKHVLTPSPIKTVAQELGYDIAQPEHLHRCQVLRAKCQFLVTVSYGQILSEDLLRMPSIAAVNVHASLLPQLRGASPIQHAILRGHQKTGVTVQRMVKELDAGPILSQRTITINQHDTYTMLHDALATLGAELLIETIAGPLHETHQDHSLATYCKKLEKGDGIADPTTMDAPTIDRMVRALSPWPGVTIKGKKILATSLTHDDHAMVVRCAGDSTLWVTRVQPPSGKPMTGKEFERGRNTLHE